MFRVVDDDNDDASMSSTSWGYVPFSSTP